MTGALFSDWNLIFEKHNSSADLKPLTNSKLQIKKIEKVQSTVQCFLHAKPTGTAHSRGTQQIASLSMFYKINHGLVRIKFPDYIKPTLRNRFSIPYSRIDAHTFILPKKSKTMEGPTPYLINCPALGTFRAGIDQYLH